MAWVPDLSEDKHTEFSRSTKEGMFTQVTLNQDEFQASELGVTWEVSPTSPAPAAPTSPGTAFPHAQMAGEGEQPEQCSEGGWINSRATRFHNPPKLGLEYL